MIIIKKAADLRDFIARQRLENRTIGFVPTMGALHAGHLDLVRQSRQHCAVTVCSIFVNPTQFNDSADFKKYPQTLHLDIPLLESVQADVLFIPQADEVYTNGLSNLEHYELGTLESILEGRYRPGHFQGVCQVMSRLLKIVVPDSLFMGQKDYQQCMVVNRLLGILDMTTLLVTCPTIREPDGLAMSSRNLRLSPEQRQTAPLIFKTLVEIRDSIGNQSHARLSANGLNTLRSYGFKPDYLEIVRASDLLPATDHEKNNIVIITAVYLGEIRLIDNLTVAKA